MNVILYSTGCPKCNVLKKKMDAKGVNYVENNDIDKMERLGIQQVPMLCVDGDMMDFVAANDWINKM